MNNKKTLFKEKKNSAFFLRPRFSIDLDENFEEVLQKFSDVFHKKETEFTGNIVDGHIFISVPKVEEHFGRHNCI